MMLTEIIAGFVPFAGQIEYPLHLLVARSALRVEAEVCLIVEACIN